MKDSEYAIVRLQEVVDDMTQALQNVAKVVNQQKMLCEIIEKSKKAEQFKEFIEGTKKDIDTKQGEYDALLKHRNMLVDLIKQHSEADEHDKAMIENTILTIFVAFNVIQETALEDKPAA